MKAIAAILLLVTSGPVLAAESANPPPTKTVKSDQPYVYDSLSRPIPKTSPGPEKPINTTPPQKKDRELGIG